MSGAANGCGARERWSAAGNRGRRQAYAWGAVVLTAVVGARGAWAEEAEGAEARDSRQPAAIQASGVPTVPAELAAKLASYQAVRQATFQGWSPDGQGMLVATRFGNTAQLHRVYAPGGRREQWTFFEEPVSGRFLPGPRKDMVLISAAKGGDENWQVLRLDRETGNVGLLTDGTSRNELGPVARDGSGLIVHSNRRNGRDTDIYWTPSEPGAAAQLLVETDGQFWRALDLSADGAQLLLARYVSINESYPAVLEMATRTLRRLPLPAKAPVSYGEAKFSPDGKRVYLTCDARGEFRELAELDLATCQYRWLTGDVPWDIETVEVDDSSGRVALVANEDGSSRLYVLEGETRRAIDVPLGVITELEFSPDGKQLGFTLARPEAPSDAYAVDVASGTLTQWTMSEAGGLDARQFVRPELVRYPSWDQKSIAAYYYRPSGAAAEKPAAVVIAIHGGPEAQYRPIFSGTFQYYLRELGIAVICPNVRGSDGYGKSFLKLDNGPKRMDSVRDIGSLLDWIATRPELDAKRVAVYGGSYGGYMVLASVAEFGERIRAGVDIVGIGNFITFLERTSPYRRDLRRAEYGDERDPEMRAVFERINPAGQVERMRAALLVIHGVNDPRVPFFEAEQMVARLRELGREVWTVYADNEGHGFAKKDNRDYQTAAEVLFLSRQLGGVNSDN